MERRTGKASQSAGPPSANSISKGPGAASWRSPVTKDGLGRGCGRLLYPDDDGRGADDARCALGKLFAEDLSGVDSEELRTLKAMPQAAFVPPDPILKFYTERRIKGIERDEAGER